MSTDARRCDQKRDRRRDDDAERMRRSLYEWPRPSNHRLEAGLYEIPGQPCSFTIRTYGQTRPFADPALASIAHRSLLDCRLPCMCEIDVFCIMPNHVHLVARPISSGYSSLRFTDRFKGLASFHLGNAGWGGKVWQPRSHDHLIGRDEAMDRIVAYTLHNPVRAGLCASPEDYPWAGIPEPLAVQQPR